MEGGLTKSLTTLNQASKDKEAARSSGISDATFNSMGMETYGEAAAFIKSDRKTAARKAFRQSQKPQKNADSAKKPPTSYLNPNQFAKHVKTLGLEEGKKHTPTMIRTAAANRLAEHSRIELPANATPAMKAAHTRRGNNIITSVNALSIHRP
jgi:hypothetical protein